MRHIDLNSDVGEHPDQLARDERLAALVTSINIACGGHAGDDATMRALVAAAARHGTRIGAHPGYPDRAGFGRTSMAMPIDDLERSVREQVERLAGHAAGVGGLAHVKPHGALYHDAGRDRAVAEAIARACAGLSPRPALVALAGAPALAWWRALGFEALGEAFADRVYEPDGSLRARSLPGALITDPETAARQAQRLVARADVHTVCVHSDTAGCEAIAAATRRGLDAAL